MVDILPGEVLNNILEILEELRKGYYLKEEFLGIIHHLKEMDVEKQITKWISKCIGKNIKEFMEAEEYILNSFIDKRYSNGFVEGINNKIKVIKRIGFGYKSFKLFRGRILYIFNDKISGLIRNKK